MLLVANPAKGAVLLAETILGVMLAPAEQFDLLRLDLGQVLRMDVAAPEVRVLEILVRGVAEHRPDAGADKGRSVVAGRGETVDDDGGGPEQEIEPLPRALARLFSLFPLGHVGPRAHDLDGIALSVPHHVLLVVHPEIGAVGAANAVFERALVALEHLVNPGGDARDVVRVDAIAPEEGVVEIFPRGAAEQPGDAFADEGRLRSEEHTSELQS